MDVNFLSSVIESYMVNHNVYGEYNKQDINKIKKTLIEDVAQLVTILREDNIELYDWFYDKPKSFQTSVLHDYFDMSYKKNDEEQLNEIIASIGVLTGVGLAMVAYAMKNKITGYAFKQMSNIGTFMEALGTFLSKRGRYSKFRYAILNKNAKQCYIDCKVDEEEISAFSYFSLKKSPSNIPFTTEKSAEQAKCLRNCYMTHSIEAISMLMEDYFACLKQNGEFGQVESARPDDILKIISGIQVGSTCEEYYKFAKESIDKFEDLLDFIYEKDSDKQKERMRLKDKVIKARTTILRTNNLNQYNK